MAGQGLSNWDALLRLCFSVPATCCGYDPAAPTSTSQ